MTTQKTEALISLKAQRDAVKSDYSNPARETIIKEYHAEMERLGRRYFDDRLNAWAMDHGALYGEDTMLDMIEEGTFNLDELNESVQRHCGKILDDARAGE